MVFLPYVLAAASIAGAIGGAKGTKYIDEDFLEKMTGSRKYAQLFNDYLRELQSSPEGQNMYRAASDASAQIVNSTIGTGGAGPDSTQTGTQALSVALAPQVSNNMRNQVTGALGQQAGKMAQQTISDRLSAYLNDKGRQTTSGKIWSAIGQAAGVGLNAGWGAGQNTGGTTKTDGGKTNDGNDNTNPPPPPASVAGDATGQVASAKPAAQPQIMQQSPAPAAGAVAYSQPARQQQMLNFKPTRNATSVGGGTGRFRGTTLAPQGDYA